MGKLESEFVADTVKPELERRLPGCIITKLDSGMIRGIPDLLVLWEDKWATLETKRGRRSAKQPNQDWYVEKMDEMSYSAFINPDNYEEVLDGLQAAFRTER